MPDPYLTPVELAARYERLSAESDGKLALHVTRFEDIAERYIGVSYRERAGTHTGWVQRSILELPHRQVTVVTLADEEDVAVTFERLYVDRGAVEVHSCALLTATYTHGYEDPTELLLSACALYVARKVAVDNSGMSRDVLSQNFDGGTTRYATPDWNAGRPTGFLDVDADLNSMRSQRIHIF